MQYNFDNIDVAVNRTGILTLNASVNSDNAIEPAYVLGYRKPVNQLPYGGINTTFNLSYYPNIDAEPNFAVVNKIKNLTQAQDYFGEKLEVGGLTQNYCFLNSYNLRIAPNNLIEANVSYITFWDLCGNIRGKSNAIDYFYSGNLCHSWETFLSSGEQRRDIYEISYDFQANWKPIYRIGSKYPVEVKLMDGAESISFAIDEYRNISFTGENVYPTLISEGDGNLYMRNLSLICENGCEATQNLNSLYTDLNNLLIKTTSLNSQVGEFVRVNYQARRFF